MPDPEPKFKVEYPFKFTPIPLATITSSDLDSFDKLTLGLLISYGWTIWRKATRTPNIPPRLIIPTTQGFLARFLGFSPERVHKSLCRLSGQSPLRLKVQLKAGKFLKEYLEFVDDERVTIKNGKIKSKNGPGVYFRRGMEVINYDSCSGIHRGGATRIVVNLTHDLIIAYVDFADFFNKGSDSLDDPSILPTQEGAVLYGSTDKVDDAAIQHHKHGAVVPSLDAAVQVSDAGTTALDAAVQVSDAVVPAQYRTNIELNKELSKEINKKLQNDAQASTEVQITLNGKVITQAEFEKIKRTYDLRDENEEWESAYQEWLEDEAERKS